MSQLCDTCRTPLHDMLVALGETRHPGCDAPVPRAVPDVSADEALDALLAESEDVQADGSAARSAVVPPMATLPRPAATPTPEPPAEMPEPTEDEEWAAIHKRLADEFAEPVPELPHNGEPVRKVPVLNPEDTLFPDLEMPPPVSLGDRFGIPPFSVWDKSAGDWQSRKRRWLSMGIQSELGREEGLTIRSTSEFMIDAIERAGGTTSIFDPVVCELVYRWWSEPGDKVLDPFAGGSVRGVTAGVLQRRYVGNDLRPEQVAADRAQAHLVGSGGLLPTWFTGDATELPAAVRRLAPYDMVFSCPPYADLEQYSDDPHDLSNMPYREFARLHASAIHDAVKLLHANRFAVWVISDVRDKKTGLYRGLVAHTIEAFQAAGAELYNDIILREPVGTARLRGARYFNGSRKVVRTHQHVLVFVKGDWRLAAKRLTNIDPQALHIGGGDAE